MKFFKIIVSTFVLSCVTCDRTYAQTQAQAVSSVREKSEAQTWVAAVDNVSKQKNQLVLLAVPDTRSILLKPRIANTNVQSLAQIVGSAPRTWNNIIYFPRNLYREWKLLEPPRSQNYKTELVAFLASLSAQQLNDLSQGKSLALKSLTKAQSDSLVSLANFAIPLKIADLQHPDDKRLSIYIEEPGAFVFYKGSSAPRSIQEVQLHQSFSPFFSARVSGVTEPEQSTRKIIRDALKNPDKIVNLKSATSWSLPELFQAFQNEFKSGSVKVVSQSQRLRIAVSGGDWKLQDLLTLSVEATDSEVRQVNNILIVGQKSATTAITSQSNLTRSIETDYQKLLAVSRFLLKSPKSTVPEYLRGPMMNAALISYKNLTKQQADWLSNDASAPADFLLKSPAVNDVEVAFAPLISFEIDSPTKPEKTYAGVSATFLYSWLVLRTRSQE